MTTEALDSLDLLKKGKKNLPNIVAITKCNISEEEFLPGVDHQWRKRGGIQITAKAFEESVSHMTIFNSFDVWICAGKALDRMQYPLYVELAHCPPPNHTKVTNQSALSFWVKILSLSGSTDAALSDQLDKCLRRQLQPIYIPAEFAHYQGWFFHELVGSMPRLKALLISSFGIRNPKMCRNCIISYLLTTSWNDEHILWPFHCCISIKGFQSGQCSNCVWNTKSNCDWRSLSVYQADKPRSGLLEAPLLGKDNLPQSGSALPADKPREVSEDQLNPRLCPRITSQWPLVPWDSELNGEDVVKAAKREIDKLVGKK
ncbi:hypothetical protein DER46DRAFT_629412 [Fusarium sp. MPI-SDFR-AT-0072]|nr:hypothetical protein DER46DRAFT_629412 [Fusarium sp. MPI-SDFR-AT-0072]